MKYLKTKKNLLVIVLLVLSSNNIFAARNLTQDSVCLSKADIHFYCAVIIFGLLGLLHLATQKDRKNAEKYIEEIKKNTKKQQ